jgi:hypothetical protein
LYHFLITDKKAISGKLPVCSVSSSNPIIDLFFHTEKISFLLDYFIPGGLVAELGVGARSPLCFVGKPLDFGIAELFGGGTLPVLLF